MYMVFAYILCVFTLKISSSERAKSESDGIYSDNDFHDLSLQFDDLGATISTK